MLLLNFSTNEHEKDKLIFNLFHISLFCMVSKAPLGVWGSSCVALVYIFFFIQQLLHAGKFIGQKILIKIVFFKNSLFN